MSEPTAALSSELDRVADELRSADRFLLTTHEGPDGDALGSLLAMHHVLEQLGKDAVMFLGAKEFPLAVEYRFLPLEEVFHEPPADVVDRTLVFLDCGNIDRMPVEFLQRDGARLINIDHHHDNTRFGTINLVDIEASCTAEIVLEVAKRLGAEITPEIASALYVGLVTDTGMFQYENTGVAAHRMAAELIEAGVDVNDTFRRLYERVPIEKVRLIARALDKIELFDDGRFGVTYVSASDYADTGAGEVHTEGIIDFVRALEGVDVAAMIRDKTDGGNSARKVSLRSTDGSVDVSAIARAQGGGGHRRAAGFGSDLPYEELVEFLRAEIAAQLGG
ncbi:MAG: bifunctional oligoribonuclease and phosphatase NrnA [Solirubrobacterales bacterium]|jgi:phosphoesterase RecJ-like protein|nr:bifunctional oligoribonuclease and phosphatase NrnA [Solirubrobacterales bacterium]